MSDDGIEERIAAVRRTVAAAAARAGRDPASVGIIAVTKTHPPAAVRAALEAGLTDVGENYVQEARAKRHLVHEPVTWHLIGGLQLNKVRAAVAVFDRIQTVDSPELAAALADAAGRARRRLPVLIQVNVAGDPAKRGVAPEAAERLGRTVLSLPELLLEGFMTVPAQSLEPEAMRPYFRLLRSVRDGAAERLGVELPHLSMGMSHDFAVAVEEGATWLRLGRVLLGARGPSAWRPGASAGGEGS